MKIVVRGGKDWGYAMNNNRLRGGASVLDEDKQHSVLVKFKISALPSFTAEDVMHRLRSHTFHSTFVSMLRRCGMEVAADGIQTNIGTLEKDETVRAKGEEAHNVDSKEVQEVQEADSSNFAVLATVCVAAIGLVG